MANDIRQYVGSPTYTEKITTAGSGTVNVPPWAVWCEISVQASGGGGGGSSATQSGGAGSGGCFVKFEFPISGVTSIAYTLGDKGNGGAASANGNDATNSSVTIFGTVQIVGGGKKGNFNGAGGDGGIPNPATRLPMTALAGGPLNGAANGSTTSDNNVIIRGGGGGGGGTTGTNNSGGATPLCVGGLGSGTAGAGGSSAMGRGATAVTGSGANGNPGQRPGAGGGGARSGGSGGTGGAGLLGQIVFYFE